MVALLAAPSATAWGAPLGSFSPAFASAFSFSEARSGDARDFGPLDQAYALPSASASSAAAVGAGRGSARAFSSLLTGEMKAEASGNGVGCDGLGPCAFGQGVATAQLRDSLFLSVAGAAPTTVTQVTFDILSQGVITDANRGGGFLGSNPQHLFSARVAALQEDGGGNLNLVDKADAFVFQYQGGIITTVAQSIDLDNDVLSATTLLVQPDDYRVRLALDILGPTARFNVLFSLTVVAGKGDTADFFNTATVRLNAPANVSLTSESGVFLTNVAAPVPAPAAASLFATGLLACVGLRLASPRRTA